MSDILALGRRVLYLLMVLEYVYTQAEEGRILAMTSEVQ
jgi:hypothetical protein